MTEYEMSLATAKVEITRLHALNRELILQLEQVVAKLDMTQKALATEKMRVAYLSNQVREQRKVTS